MVWFAWSSEEVAGGVLAGWRFMGEGGGGKWVCRPQSFPISPTPRPLQVYLPFYERLMIRDRSRFEAAMGRIVGWDFDAVLPCHGVYLPCGGKQVRRRSGSGARLDSLTAVAYLETKKRIAYFMSVPQMALTLFHNFNYLIMLYFQQSRRKNAFKNFS